MCATKSYKMAVKTRNQGRIQDFFQGEESKIQRGGGGRRLFCPHLAFVAFPSEWPIKNTFKSHFRPCTMHIYIIYLQVYMDMVVADFLDSGSGDATPWNAQESASGVSPPPESASALNASFRLGICFLTFKWYSRRRVDVLFHSWIPGYGSLKNLI